MNKESKLNLNAGDYAISHCDSNKTYNGLEVHKMLCDAYIAGNNDTLDDKDEEIRKALINVFATHKDYEMFFGVSVKDIRAWLEEQGEKSNWKPSNEEMDVLYGLAYITNQYDEHKEEVITRLYKDLKREFFNGSSYENMFPNTEDDVRRRSTIQVLEYARSLDTYNQYGKADINKNIAWLEKQSDIGEDLIAKKYLINKGYPIDTNGTFPTYEEMYNIIREGLEKQGLQKPIDKVEPRFKVGDWIVENGVNRNPVQITSFEEDKGSGIKVWFSNGTGTYIEFLKDYHKWTIQDAKDGDILFLDLMDGKTFIYNGTSPNMEILYSFIISNDDKDVLPYHIGEPNTGIGNIEEIKNIIYPATKEQRDLLFSKMKEAGYEWSEETHKLKKLIENNHTWSEEDEIFVHGLIRGLTAKRDIHGHTTFSSDCIDITETIDWLKSLKDRVTQKSSEDTTKPPKFFCCG